MPNYIPLYGNNIAAVASTAGIDHEELIKRQQEAQADYQKQSDKQWALDKLGYDEKWWDATMQKIADIKSNLPQEMSYQEKTIALYGWIKTSSGDTFSLPMMDHEYGHACAVEAILTNPSRYLTMLNWD